MHHHWLFQKNVTIILQISIKYLAVILIGIALNSYINLESIVNFTIFSLSNK